MQQSQIQYQPYPNSVPDNEIDLIELFSALWSGKWIIIAITAIFAIGSAIYAIEKPNIYKADALVAPAESSGGGGLSKMAGQLGGLAALAGVNIGGTNTSQADLAIEVLKSRQFIDSFIKEHDLLVPLMATKGWNEARNELIIDEDIYDAESKNWLRKSNGVQGTKPSSQEAYQVFSKDILNIIQNKDSGLYTFSVKHYSPYIAQQWVTWLIQDINKTMRERTISDTTQNLMYLNAQLQKTAVADMKATFYTLIEEQTKSLMLAEVQDEFTFKVIDPAVVPEVKYEPKRFMICILGAAIGFILVVMFVLLRFLLLSQRR
ncbi:Wzz/FepE/Etk N-terminal domain-containing protein [Acinetobacter venetianus]|uniref:Wzz/FepE/Etk N-terminal domain-containing protein n=1 Tax=Acinetobacter venetianus TaxID=52133 RepID=UPI003A957267